MNNCTLVSSNAEGYKRCLRCYLNRMITASNAITLERNCTPIPDNYCVDLHFNTTELFQNFFQNYSTLINELFEERDSRLASTFNSLYIHIEYDTLETFSFSTFQSLDQVKNRKYHGLSFELKHRDNRLTLPLNENINQMNLTTLQIIIYCGSKGLYQYHYTPDDKQQPFRNSLICEIPTTTTTIRMTTVRNNRSQMILIFTLIGGGSLIPCLILVCCLFILCKQNYEKKAFEYQHRESFNSTSTDSILSDQS